MYSSRFAIIVAIAVMFPTTAFAEECFAIGNHSNTKHVQGNKYIISFNIESDDCATSACNGNLTFSVRYDKVRGKDDQAEITQTVGFKIPRGSIRASIDAPTSVGENDNIEILDVTVDEVTCTTP